VVLNERREVLLVHHNRPRENGRDRFWVVPGGDVERGETSRDAAIREVREETGIEVDILRLLWHVEEIDPKGALRSTAFFLGVPTGGDLRVGVDPELPPDAQVIDDARYFDAAAIAALDRVYPEVLRHDFWRLLRQGVIVLAQNPDPVYRVRPCPGFGL
jgi:ADP-ribose pyrophosphatase YjhB (NUDIX family)